MGQVSRTLPRRVVVGAVEVGPVDPSVRRLLLQASAFTLRPLQIRRVNGYSRVQRGAETFSLARPAHALGREMHASRHICTGRAHRARFARASPPAEPLLSDSASRSSLGISPRHTRKPTSPGLTLRALLAGPAATAPWPAHPRRTARLPAPTRPHTGPAGPSSGALPTARRRRFQHFLRLDPVEDCQR